MMTSGPILSALIRFTLPILFSLFLQALYGAVDLWMVGKFATNADVSAVTTGSQTMQIVNALVIGLSLGITVMVGRRMGARDDEGAARVVGASLWLFTGLAALISLILVTGAVALAAGLNAPQSAFGATVEYLRICGAGVVFIVFFNLLTGLFTGLGDSKTPLIFVGVAAVANMAGDYWLVAILHAGAAGAARATVGSQCLSVLTALLFLRKKLPFKMAARHLAFDGRLIAGILKLGFPIALQNACNELSYLLIIGFVNVMGVVASSGVGIAEKLVMFILLIPTAFMLAISAFVAHNRGAGLDERAGRVLVTGLFACLAIGSVMSYLSFFEGPRLALLFINDPAVIVAAAEFLKATSIECFFFAMTYPVIGYLMGYDRTAFVMVQGMIAIFTVRIPYAWWASTKPEPELFDVGLATGLAAMAMTVMCMGYWGWMRRRTREERGTSSSSVS